MRKTYFFYLVAILVLTIDQISKIWVHFNMEFGAPGEIPILGKWLRLHYTLNPGMAFGIRIGFKYGKFFLTSFRIFATYVIASYLPKLVNNVKVSILVIYGWTLILGGALGNIFDSVFYGIFFDNAPPSSPMKLFHGQVIDMILVGIENIYLPKWVPFIGGDYLPGFPIFNLADTAISTGVGLIILDSIIIYFKKKYKKNKIKSSSLNHPNKD